jgi:DNA-binding response OmpR family regulator
MDGTRILIVDDEAEAGEILSLRLARRGLVPASVLSGEAALEYLKTNPADIVLLDVKMPGMDGLETLRHIREGYPQLPVIILSGHADLDAAARGMELGAFFYLMKPADLEDLCRKIEDARRQAFLDGGKTLQTG